MPSVALFSIHSFFNPAMSSQEENPPYQDERVRFVQERLQSNPQQFLNEMEAMPNELAQLRAAAKTPSPSASDPPVSTLNPALAPSLDPQIAALMMLLLARNPEPRSEKLPDIPEYDGDEARLDAWEQSLIQRMHINNDRYPSDESKIAYAENRLIIGKTAHNLMNSYRVDGLCTLTSFSDWRFALRRACGNPYEQEDARKYLRETLKQGSMSFEEYYNLFSQKKDRSRMEDASLIEAMKTNVNYSTHSAALMYRVPGTNRQPITFDEHVTMWLETDRGLRQIRHLAPKSSNTTAGVNASAAITSTSRKGQSTNQPSAVRAASVPPLPPPQHLCPSATRWILALLWPQSRAIH